MFDFQLFIKIIIRVRTAETKKCELLCVQMHHP